MKYKITEIKDSIETTIGTCSRKDKVERIISDEYGVLGVVLYDIKNECIKNVSTTAIRAEDYNGNKYNVVVKVDLV